MDGILNIFKPRGISSYRLVREVKNILKAKKAGHAGTLDPFASGVLLVGINQATKILEFMSELEKHYEGEMVLGISTDTQDAEGKIIQKKEVDPTLDRKKIELIFQRYKGTISQVPPMFSAVHYEGKRLYQLARVGKIVERKPREVNIYQLNLIDLIKGENPIIKFEVVCSKGTYIRTLCNDIGEELGCGAYLSNLVRRRIGTFHIEDSLSLEDLKKDLTLAKKFLITMDSALKGLEKITVGEDEARKILNGGFIFKKTAIETSEETPIIREDKLIKIVDGQGNLLALGTPRIKNRKDLIIKPIKVFKISN